MKTIKNMKPKSLGLRKTTYFLTGLCTIGSLLTQLANAELVLDKEEAAVAQDRSLTRDAIESGREARTNIRAESTPIPTTSAPEVSSDDQMRVPEDEDLKRSELLRRNRLRRELQNEDILQQRLEELRIREEENRTRQLVEADASQLAKENQLKPTSEIPSSTKMEEVKIGAVVTTPSTGSSEQSIEQNSEKIGISFQARGGLSGLVAQDTMSVRPKFAVGLGIGIKASDSIGIDVGVSKSQMGVSFTSINPLVQSALALSNATGQRVELVNLDQNIIDLGLKFYFLKPEVKLKPFLGAGGAYIWGTVNYDSQLITILQQQGYRDQADSFGMSSFAGHLSTGLDVRVSETITVGALFRYYLIMSSRQSQSITTPLTGTQLFNGYTGYYTNAYQSAFGAYDDADKRWVRDNAASASVYSVLVGVTLSF